jgi:hypothetical protein
MVVFFVGSGWPVRLSSINECDTKMMNVMTGHVASDTKITGNQ